MDLISFELNKLKGLNLATEAKILSMVLYKHINQMRKTKYMQYLRQLIKNLSRIKYSDILELYTPFFGCNTLKSKLLIRKEKYSHASLLIRKSELVIKTLATCQDAAFQIISNMQLGTFMTFNTFAFSSISRIRFLLIALLDAYTNLSCLTLSLPDNEVDQPIEQEINEKADILHDLEMLKCCRSGFFSGFKRTSNVYRTKEIAEEKAVDIGECLEVAETVKYDIEPKVLDVIGKEKTEGENGLFHTALKRRKILNKRKRISTKKHSLICTCWICEFEIIHFRRLRLMLIHFPKNHNVKKKKKVKCWKSRKSILTKTISGTVNASSKKPEVSQSEIEQARTHCKFFNSPFLNNADEIDSIFGDI